MHLHVCWFVFPNNYGDISCDFFPLQDFELLCVIKIKLNKQKLAGKKRKRNISLLLHNDAVSVFLAVCVCFVGYLLFWCLVVLECCSCSLRFTWVLC